MLSGLRETYNRPPSTPPLRNKDSYALCHPWGNFLFAFRALVFSVWMCWCVKEAEKGKGKGALMPNAEKPVPYRANAFIHSRTLGREEGCKHEL